MFKTYLYNPIYDFVIFLYNNWAFHDLGIAIILLTLLLRLVLFPLFYKGAKNQLILQKLQPEIQKIQHDHKDNKEKQAQEMMGLYKKYKVNPLSSFLIILIQLPILIALYQVILSGDFSGINTLFLGLINLKTKSIFIVGLAALAQYYQGVLTLPPAVKGRELSQPEKMGRYMVYFGPVFTLFILTTLPSAVGLYWLATSVFSIIQQIYINKTVKI
ncbi:MAG: YidC/Oxa1 family membrane protein insertase [bacterium]|nr:YidC/Oxa1 family membrane protein insertase [bacterium]